MTTATITKPVATEDVLADLDFSPSCHMYNRNTGEQCDRQPVAFIEFHRVNHCKDPECNAAGNMEGNVCQEHLDYTIELAAEVVNTPQPPSPFRGSLQLVCGTCRMPINKASDVLQKVIRL